MLERAVIAVAAAAGRAGAAHLTGINRRLVELSGEHRLAFALLCVGSLLIAGLLLGLLTEAVLSLFGWHTKPFDAAE